MLNSPIVIITLSPFATALYNINNENNILPSTSFITNAGQLQSLSSFNNLLPVTETMANNSKHQSYITSFRAHYILYAADEIRLHVHNIILKYIALFILFIIDLLIQCTRSDQCIFINNLLVSTNLYPSMNEIESNTMIEHEIQVLVQKYPQHAIIWKSLDEIATPTLLTLLQHRPISNPGLPLFSRVVNHLTFINSSSSVVWKRKALMSDMLVFERVTGMERTTTKAIQKGTLSLNKAMEQLTTSTTTTTTSTHELITLQPEHAHDILLMQRLQYLYECLYRIKYSKHNPAYTWQFFQHVIRKNLWEIVVARPRQEQELHHIEGFMAFYSMGDFITAPAVGYVTSNSSNSLYVVLQFYACLLAKSRNLNLNMSGGVAHYKRARGAKSVIEYSIVHCSHLPWWRQIFYRFLSFISRTIVVPIIKRKV
jgi:hypothetical protein